MVGVIGSEEIDNFFAGFGLDAISFEYLNDFFDIRLDDLDFDISETNFNNIDVIKIEMFLIENKEHPCDRCEKFIKTRTYERLLHFKDKFFRGQDFKVIIQPRGVDWECMNDDVYLDEDVKNSGYVLKPLELTEVDKNYFISIAEGKEHYPKIKVYILYKNNVLRKNIYSGISHLTKETENSGIIESNLIGEILRFIRDEDISAFKDDKNLLHDVARYTISGNEVSLSYDMKRIGRERDEDITFS